MANNSSNTLLLKGIALLLMLLAPPLLLYPGTINGNVFLQIMGWVLLVVAMIIPLTVK
jgi:hypothetical protein